MAATLAGLCYGAGLFGAGFMLALVRLPVLVPAIGPLAATLVELPIILAVAFWLAGRIARWRGLSDARQLVVMGLVGFGVLLAIECLFAFVAFGRTPADIAAGWFTKPEEAVGLAGQLVTIAFPTLARRVFT